MIDPLKLREYGGRVIEIGDRIGIELVDPNDGAGRRFQYRRQGAGLERRILGPDGQELADGSPWEPWATGALEPAMKIRLIRYAEETLIIDMAGGFVRFRGGSLPYTGDMLKADPDATIRTDEPERVCLALGLA